jgi:putative glutamine amidotransferase
MSAAVPRETWGDFVVRSTGSRMRIGLSFDQGTPKYRLYVGALLAAAEAAFLPVEAVWIAGAGRDFDRQALTTIDGLILTGGADVEPQRYGHDDPMHDCRVFPGRDDVELGILEAAIERRIPIFAICRGMQLLNVFRGGTLIPQIGPAAAHQLQDHERHSVLIEPGTALHKLAKCAAAPATSSHHQAIGELGRGLRISASHSDGTIEAIEWIDPMRKPWMLGVQWHPERMSPDETLGGAIYSAFLEAVHARRA